MQAAEKKIIIERGADFRISLQLVEGVGTPKDISTFTVGMNIKYYNKETDTIEHLQPNGTLTATPYVFAGTLLGDPAGSGGEFEVVIDKSITVLFDPKLDMTKMTDRFGTEYNYFYHIDIQGAGGSTLAENKRVLRGKCAVRN